MTRRSAVVASAVAAFGCWTGCASGPAVGRADERFERCSDPAAQEAYDRAEALAQRGRQAESIQYYRTVVSTCVDYLPAHVRYQDVALALGGVAEQDMRVFYAQRADQSGSPVQPYLVSRLVDDDADRLPLLAMAIERDRSFFRAYLDRAMIYKDINRIEVALDNLDRAVATNCNDPVANRELAEVLYGLGRGEEAASYFESYFELRPDDLEAKRRYLGLLTYSLGRLDAAADVALELLQYDDKDAAVRMDVAAIRWQRGDFEGARAEYHRVLDLDPTMDRAVLNLGNLYYEALPAGTEEGRREFWPKARAAYRYFVGLRQAEGLYDVLDAHVGVPYRLQQIEALLGPGPEQEPGLDDF